MITPLRAKQHTGFSRRRRSTPATVSGATIFRLRPRLELMEDRTLLTTYLVNSTDDGGPGSLRQAILDSNNAVGATNVIDFDISGNGVRTIFPLSALPAISSPVLIDGTSQPGYAGTPLIELNGSQNGANTSGLLDIIDGLTITGAGVTVRGLEIDSFYQGGGIHITGTGATHNWIYGNFLGTDPTGTQAEANDFGVEIDAGASDNLIGTNGDGIEDESERNLISGNNQNGVSILGADSGGNLVSSAGNIVAGNFIGTDVTGTLPLGNNSDGVGLDTDATANWIGVNPYGGTDYADEGNVIAASGYLGVSILSASSNVVAGNEIGTDLAGTQSLPNGIGVFISGGSLNNTIGGTTRSAGNLITDNNGPGVAVGYSVDDACVGNEITGNRIFGNTGQAIDLGDDGVTYNGTAPRQGPNNLQNFPIIVTTDDGQLQGWLGGSTPNTAFDIEFFASAAYGPGGAGEAQDYLGSLEVTTDGQGQAVFDVPYAPPADLPVVTATATDPHGNTSEVSALRQGVFDVPTQAARLTPGQTLLLFSAASGDGIALSDPDAGPFDLTWDLSLSVRAGTLTVASTAGLTGSGNGTDSLSYSGSLSVLNAALTGMTFAPPAGFQGNATLSIEAQSDGASPVDSQVLISDGFFLVTTTADSGPGSLRQAILDSNAATGGTNTINFAIPGQGVQMIAPDSSLPAITEAVLIDGTTQPGYAGTPLIGLSGSQASGDGLDLSAPDIAVRRPGHRWFLRCGYLNFVGDPRRDLRQFHWHRPDWLAGPAQRFRGCDR